MKKTYKIIGKIAVVLLILGIVFVGIGILFGAGKRSFKNDKFFRFVINPSVEKLEYTVLEEFDAIDLNIDTGDIVIKEGEEFAIEYALYEGSTYEVKNNTLFVNKYDGEIINIGFGIKTKDTYVTIYIPENMEIDIKNIDTDMGDVKIINGYGWNFKNVNINADMGNIEFEGNAYGRIKIEADMGDVNLRGYLGCDISVEADMGDVDICTYYNKENYRYEIDVDMGEKEINENGGEKIEGNDMFDIEVNCDMGDVKLTFEDK